MGNDKKPRLAAMFSDSSGADLQYKPVHDDRDVSALRDQMAVRNLLDESSVAPRFELQSIRRNSPSIDWMVTTLGEVAKIIMGQSPPSYAVNTDGIGVPFFQGNAEFGPRFPTPTRWTTHGIRFAQPGDILISVRAPVGELNVAREVSCIGRGLAAICAEAAHQEFTYQALQLLRPELSKRSQGSTFDAISGSELRCLKLALPPLAEQKKIAQILSSVDEAIEATQAVIDQTRRVKEAMLQTLLTRGLGHTRFKQTEIGEIPEAWKLYRCEDLTHQISVGIVVRPTQYYVPRGVKCWRSANIGEGFVRDSEWVYISEESNELMRKSRLKAGDVVIVRTGFPGTACVVPPELNDTNCVDILFVKPRHSIILSSFLAWFINSIVGKRQVLKMQGGLAQKHLNAGELNKMLVPLPSIEEQATIVSHIQQALTTLQSNTSAMEALQLVKSALLQTLLSGQTRVTP
ncbi:restriction endonuclease subunit S [Myxococcota bacterium]|nr:restriction endonuclease subunit S [Myxococcota bacterium]